MARRTLSRGLVVAAATAAMVTTIAPLMTTTANAATATPSTVRPSETVIPATQQAEPADGIVYFAGTTGYLHQLQRRSGYEWTTYADGTSTPVTGYLDGDDISHSNGSGGDTVVTAGSGDDAGKLVFTDMATGKATAVPRPAGWTVLGQFDGRVLEQSGPTGVPSVLSLNEAGTATVSTPVTGWPADDAIKPKLLAGDTKSAVMLVKTAAGYQLAVIDLATATTTVLPGTVGAGTAATVGAHKIAWWNASGGVQDPAVVGVLDRDDLAGTPAHVTLQMRNVDIEGLRVVGDWLVTANTDPDTMEATPIAGGDPVALPGGWIPVPAQDGDSLVGKTSTDGSAWRLSRISQGDDGELAVTPLAATNIPQQVTHLNLSGGQLLTTEQDLLGDKIPQTRTVTLSQSGDGKPTVSDPSALALSFPENADVPMLGTGTAGGAYTELANGDVIFAPDGSTRMTHMNVSSTDGTIVAANNKYTVYNGSDGKQYVYRNGQAKPLITRPAQAAGLWGDTLVSASGSKVVQEYLPTLQVHDPVDLHIPCAPTDIQAAGNWVYWSCGDGEQAGVANLFDDRGTAFGVPAEPSVLADGVLVQHDLKRGELTAIDLGVRDESGVARPADIAPLAAPADGSDDRNVSFTADPYGGGIAYVDARQNIHVLDPGAANENHLVKEIDNGITPQATVTAGKAGWSGSWLLSGPVSSAKLVITSPVRGPVPAKPIATVTATVKGNVVSASWNGLATDGTKPANGVYDYSLDLVGPSVAPSLEPWGTVTVTGGKDAYRDARANGVGSVVTMNSSGYLTTHSAAPGGGGSLDAWKSGGSGYATGDLAVPFGSLHGDGCDDTLVRTTAGELRDYPTGCGHVLGAASAKYTSLGTGWNQYKTLQYTGDLNGDKLPDLLAWSASTGDLYLYPGTAAGKLGARVLVKANQQYVRFIAVGDMNGDGNGDVLAYDHEHSLWKLLGDGKGGFSARILLWTNWGTGYNAMVGVGDINGDGQNDIVERDSSGKLWMNAGLESTFSARQQVGTGWQGYKALY